VAQAGEPPEHVGKLLGAEAADATEGGAGYEDGVGVELLLLPLLVASWSGVAGLRSIVQEVVLGVCDRPLLHRRPHRLRDERADQHGIELGCVLNQQLGTLLPRAAGLD